MLMADTKPLTLLMRFRAPMMSFGDSARFGHRDTRTEPTKSAVVGLLCAALGRPRSEPVNDLTALKMVVRVDREGKIEKDFQTTANVIDSSAKGWGATISDRYYLADAEFIVALEGNPDLVRQLDEALQFPKWQLSAGRKAFCFTLPVRAGVTDLLAEEAIAAYPYEGKGKRLRVVREVPNSQEIRRDVPLLNFEARLFGVRYVQTTFLNVNAADEN